MERKDFLKGVSLAGAAAVLPFQRSFSAVAEEDIFSPTSCTLIPSETRGPYPLPASTAVSAITRSDIRETKTGIQLILIITVQNTDCVPLAGARVDIWQCDKDGYYSGYNGQPGYLGTQNNAGTTFLRGSQTTDANGQVTFISIYPGWYTGRVTHIHAEVYIGNVLQRTSQFAFPDSLNTTVYTTSSLYTAHGTNSIINSTDNVFSDGVTDQLLTISGSVAAGYTADHTFTITYTIPLSLLSFNAGLENGKAILWWATTNEINAAYFEIEKSSDGINFSIAGTVAAKNGSGNNSYTFSDANPLSSNTYYRLKMIDKDGQYKYSNTVLLRIKAIAQLSVYPNPAKDRIILSHPVANNNSYVEVLSFDGKSIAYGKLQAGATSTTIDISILAKGIYLLTLINNNEKQAIKFTRN